MRAERRDHRGHLVAHRILFSLGADRDRRHGGERFLGQFAVMVEIAPHRPADDRQEDIVDLGTVVRRADRLDIGERDADPFDHAMRRDLAVEAGLGRDHLGRDVEFLRREPLERLGEAGRGLGRDFELLQWIGDRVEIALAEQFDGVGHLLRFPLVGAGRGRFVGAQRVRRLHQVDPAHPVDRRMVNLGDIGITALGQTFDIVEPFDHGKLPRRAVEVERAGEDARRLDAQLPPVARRGQRHVADMVFEVEIGILDPVGIIEVEGHAHHALAHRLRQLQPAFEESEDVLEPDEPAGRSRRVVDQDRPDVHRRIARFQRNETRIHPLELLHRFLSALPPLCRAMRSHILLRPAYFRRSVASEASM